MCCSPVTSATRPVGAEYRLWCPSISYETAFGLELIIRRSAELVEQRRRRSSLGPERVQRRSSAAIIDGTIDRDGTALASGFFYRVVIKELSSGWPHTIEHSELGNEFSSKLFRERRGLWGGGGGRRRLWPPTSSERNGTEEGKQKWKNFPAKRGGGRGFVGKIPRILLSFFFCAVNRRHHRPAGRKRENATRRFESCWIFVVGGFPYSLLLFFSPLILPVFL